MRRSSERFAGLFAAGLLIAALAVGGCASRPERATVEPSWSYVKQGEQDVEIWPVRAGLAEPWAEGWRDPIQP